MPGLRASQYAGLPMETRSIVPFIPVINSLILQALAPLASLRRDGRAYFKEMIKTKRNKKDAKETTKQQKRDNRQDVKERKQERGPHWVVHASCRRFNSAGPHPMCLTLRPADSMHIRGEKRQGGEKHERKKQQKDCPHLFLPGFRYLPILSLPSACLLPPPQTPSPH